MKKIIKKWLVSKIRRLLKKNKLKKYEEKYLDFLIDKFFDLEYGKTK